MPKIKKKKKIEQCTKIFIYRDLNLPDRQVKFFEGFKLQKNWEINLLIKTFLGLVEMMSGLVNVSFSLT